MSAPSHPVLRALVDIHFEVRAGLAQVLIWRDTDGTEAVVLGRRLFAAVADGPVREMPADVLARRRGGVASLRRIVRRLLELPPHARLAADQRTSDPDRLATREEVAAVLGLLQVVAKEDATSLAAAQATDWAARFALDPPAVSTLRALLGDLRLHHGPLDAVTDEAISRLRARLACGEVEPPRASSSRSQPPRAARATRRRANPARRRRTS